MSSGATAWVAAFEASGTRFFAKAGWTTTEALLTARVAALDPDSVPEVIATYTSRSLMLTCDGGTTLDAVDDVKAWRRAAANLGRLHADLAPEDLADLNVTCHAFDRLPDEFSALIMDPELLVAWGCRPSERDHAPKLLEPVVNAHRRISDLGIEPSVIHGDAHPRNVLVGEQRVIWFDWSEGAVGHPFVDAGMFLAWASHPRRSIAVRTRHDDILEQWWRRYLEELGNLGIAVTSKDAALVALAHRAVAWDAKFGSDWWRQRVGRPGYVRYALAWLRELADSTGGPLKDTRDL